MMSCIVNVMVFPWDHHCPLYWLTYLLDIVGQKFPLVNIPLFIVDLLMIRFLIVVTMTLWSSFSLDL